MISADRTTSGDYYDPDPYAGGPWHLDLVYQCEWSRDDGGQLVDWRADRTASEVLYAAGLLDATVVIHNATPGGLSWQRTTGHWHNDPYEPRRIDTIRVTPELAPTLRAVEAPDTELTRAASDFSEQGGARMTVDPKTVSDHLPVVVTYDPAKIDWDWNESKRT